jgi:starch synthase (maltosyl-transferring)
MIVYNLFPLLAGPFPGWVPHIERAAAMGFDWVFANPVQRPGASGSIYSIADYFRAQPGADRAKRSSVGRGSAEIGSSGGSGSGTAGDGRSGDRPLRGRLWIGERGSRVDCRGFRGAVIHPSCERDGSTVVWTDLAQLDHRGTADPEGLYQYCPAVIRYLLGLGFDGFRCDAAYGVPAEL